jgi:oligogalacturonide lyase
MCEHKASDPRTVAPVFSADSQRIYFQSDRDGKRALYMLRVEKFVEQTEAA